MGFKRLHAFILFVLYAMTSHANSDIYFSRIGIEQGLSQLTVNSIYQDELGSLWFATREGLNRYNGNWMEVIRPIPNDTNSLGEDLILTVCGDKNGKVFIRTQNGINIYNLSNSSMQSLQRKGSSAINYGIQTLWIAEGNKLYAYRNGVKKLYIAIDNSHAIIEKILETSDQRLILGTVSSGVYVVDQNKKMRSLLSNCSQVSDIFEDSKKNIWISTWEQGLYKLSKNADITNYRHRPENGNNSISSNFVRVVCEDNNGSLWIGTKKGLDCLDPLSNRFVHYNSERLNQQQLSNESVWALKKDSQGTIWVGTYFGGVNYFNPDQNFYTQHNLYNGEFRNKPFPVISTVIEDEYGKLFLCSEGDGLIHYNPKTTEYKTFRMADGLTSDNIKAAFYDQKKKQLWIATYLGGISMLNTHTGVFTPYRYIKPEWSQTDILSSIIPYGNGLLAGTHGGLFVFDDNTKQFTLFSEELHRYVKYIQDVEVDKLGNVWVAGIDGVYKYNPSDQSVHCFRFEIDNLHSLSNNNASKILVDSKGRIWIGTSGGGLNLYEPKTNSFKRYNEQNNGLSNDFVSSLLESRFGYIIISTTKGFSMLDVENDKILNFGPKNGLMLNSLYSGGQCLTRDGNIYITGMNGMVSFREENLSNHHRLFSLNLVNLWVNNKRIFPNDESGVLTKSLAYTDVIDLSYKQTMLTIEFASNNFIPSNEPIYRYKLDGFSDEWNELPRGVSTLNFMNLPTGDYTLVVQAVSAFSKNLITSTSLRINVHPPLYLTWYAFVFYILLTVFAVWRYLVFSRSRLLLEASLSYEKKEKENLEKVNQSKLRFFTNISHEFRTPLTLIAGQLDMLMQSHSIPPAIYNRILSIKRNTHNLQSLIDELLEFRKSEQGHLQLKVTRSNFVRFLEEIYESFTEFASLKQINFQFECNDADVELWFDSKQLQKVFYNLISNAFKYTAQGGFVTLHVVQAEHDVSISIVDSGTGINGEEIDKIFDHFYQATNNDSLKNSPSGTGIGLALTKNILDLHSAHIHVKSKPMVGSVFVVTLKKGKSHFDQAVVAEIDSVDSECLEQFRGVDVEYLEELISEQNVNNKPYYSMLIVEDNDDLREMLKSVFQPIYNVFTASDGQEGFELALEHQPHIILSDVMMPRMSGTELCSKIKNNFTVCHIPVVLLTAQTAIEYNIEGLRLGADDYISKPFSVKALVARCNNLVNNRRLLQERYSKQTDVAPRQVATNDLDREFLEKAESVIEKYLNSSEFDVPLFASELAMGRTKLFSKIKGITGQTPNDFILTVKLKKAAFLLSNHPEYNISDITYMIGFSSPKYFAKCFKEQFSISPSQYRKSQALVSDEIVTLE